MSADRSETAYADGSAWMSQLGQQELSIYPRQDFRFVHRKRTFRDAPRTAASGYGL